jgi:hypothetical protein
MINAPRDFSENGVKVYETRAKTTLSMFGVTFPDDFRLFTKHEGTAFNFSLGNSNINDTFQVCAALSEISLLSFVLHPSRSHIKAFHFLSFHRIDNMLVACQYLVKR